jgi:tRNA(Arg) A34 adenosine deaminase TadA
MEMRFMEMAIELAKDSVDRGGGPFGAVVVKDGTVIAARANSVTLDNDPTAHAEVAAIREACAKLNTFSLEGCEIYASCEPCPMCLGAIYWSGIRCVYYAATRKEAADVGFDDSLIYDQIVLAPEDRSVPGFKLECESQQQPFDKWCAKKDKTEY